MPERQIASGKAYTLRYEDEILRLTDAFTFESFEQPREPHGQIAPRPTAAVGAA
jgi:hypothetical protein